MMMVLAWVVPYVVILGPVLFIYLPWCERRSDRRWAEHRARERQLDREHADRMRELGA